MPNQTYQAAVAQHQAGQASAAEELYQEVLVGDPQHMDAVFNLAALLASQGRFGEAIPL